MNNDPYEYNSKCQHESNVVNVISFTCEFTGCIYIRVLFVIKMTSSPSSVYVHV